MVIENGVVSVGTKELWEQFDRDPVSIYRQTANEMEEAGVEDAPTMTRALEFVSPSEKGDALDAFERLMAEAGIRVISNPAAGYWASPADSFLKSPGRRALLTEFYARNWRKVSHRQPGSRAVLLSSGADIGSWERPYADAMTPRWDQRIAPAIPLDELVAMTTPIDNDAYRSLFLTYDAEQLRKFRVGESADIPIATIVSSEHTIRLHKYGRGLRASYEELRRMRVDKMAFYIQMAAVQAEIDKVAAAIDVLVNGDGNANTAAENHNLTALDASAVAGTLTARGWLAFRMEFEEPYVLTTVLLRSGLALDVALLNIGSANVPLVTLPALNGLGNNIVPINQTGDGIRLGWTSEAPANVIVGFDRRFALERVTEIGAEISEMERFIISQTQVITFSEVESFAVLDQNASHTLTVNA